MASPGVRAKRRTTSRRAGTRVARRRSVRRVCVRRHARVDAPTGPDRHHPVLARDDGDNSSTKASSDESETESDRSARVPRSADERAGESTREHHLLRDVCLRCDLRGDGIDRRHKRWLVRARLPRSLASPRPAVAIVVVSRARGASRRGCAPTCSAPAGWGWPYRSRTPG